MKKKILITNRLPREHFTMLEKRFEVVMPDSERFPAEELARWLPRISGMISSTAFPVTDAVMARAPELQIVAS